MYEPVDALEDGDGDGLLNLPIVKFPPIGLRALLIEKDPVVWAHILETYVQFFEFLMQQDHIEQINQASLDALRIFLRGYLSEMADDKGRIASLGENADVAEQLALLRRWVFALIKKCGLLHLQIHGDSLWSMVKFYVDENISSVRGLIDGSLEPSINTQKARLNRVYDLQQHLKNLVEAGKFGRLDLKAFENLLEKSIVDNEFSDSFMATTWCEVLESWWNKGKGRLSTTAKQLAIVTSLSASTRALSQTLKELGVHDIDSLSLYPLFGSILTSTSFAKRVPNLTGDIPFLNLQVQPPADTGVTDATLTEVSVNESDVQTLLEIFPHLSKYQVSQLLRMYDANVELITNKLFENPELASSIPAEQPTKPKVAAKPVKPKNAKKEFKTESLVPQRRDNKSNKIKLAARVPDEVKNRTLTRALKLLYEDDEDEVDDTYDDAEAERSAIHTRIPTDDTPEQASTSTYDKIEGYLWQLLQQDKSLFLRSSRKTKARKDIKAKTSWSDEQIEGWARMIEKSPRRAMILEKKFMFKGNARSGKTSFVQNKYKETSQDQDQLERSNRNHQQPKSNSQTNSSKTANTLADKKIQFARNEKNKSARANHNRKKGNDKKLRAQAPPPS